MADTVKYQYAILSQSSPVNFWTGPDGVRRDVVDDWFTALNTAGALGWEAIMPLPLRGSKMDWSTRSMRIDLLLKRAVPSS